MKSMQVGIILTIAVFMSGCIGQGVSHMDSGCSDEDNARCEDVSDTTDSSSPEDTNTGDTAEIEEEDTYTPPTDTGTEDTAEPPDTTMEDTRDTRETEPDTTEEPDTGGPVTIPGSCQGSTMADHFATAAVSNSSSFGRFHAAEGPDDGAFLAWRTSGQIQVAQVRADGSEVLRHTVDGSDLYGLATSDQHFALLVFRQPDILALVIARHDGTVVNDQILIGDVDHSVEGSEWFGTGIRAGRLAHTGDGWAAYYTVRRLWPDGIAHYGDQIRLFEADGTSKPGGWGWGCSHSMEVRISHNGQRLGPLCASDCYPSKGVHFNHRGGELWSDEQGSNCSGAYGTSLGASVPTSDGFWLAFTAVDERESQDVGIARTTGRSLGETLWLTADDVRDSALNAEMYGDKLLVAWNAGSNSQFALVNDPDGTVSSGPESISATNLAQSSDFFLYTNGDIGWAQRDDSGGIELARLRYCP